MVDTRDIVERLMAWRDRYGVDIAGPETPDMCEEAAAEIALLREERKPVAWCVQAAAGSMVHAGTQDPIDVPVLIQVKDETEARMMATVYGCKILAVIDPDDKEVPNG